MKKKSTPQNTKQKTTNTFAVVLQLKLASHKEHKQKKNNDKSANEHEIREPLGTYINNHKIQVVSS